MMKIRIGIAMKDSKIAVCISEINIKYTIPMKDTVANVYKHMMIAAAENPIKPPSTKIDILITNK